MEQRGQFLPVTLDVNTVFDKIQYSRKGSVLFIFLTTNEQCSYRYHNIE